MEPENQSTAVQKLAEGQMPPEGHPQVGQWAFAQFEVARKHKVKGNWHQKWLKNHELIRGKHFPVLANKKYPLVPVNLFHVAHQTTVANLTDNKPKFDIQPHDEAAKAMQPIMHEAAGQWWQNTKQQATLSASVRNSEKYGTTIEKGIFDTALEGGRGDIDFPVIDPFKFFPWPGVREIQRMPKFFEIDILELEEIRRIWPETGGQVKEEPEYSDITGKEREEVRGGSLSTSQQSSNLPTNYVAGEGYDAKLGEVKRAMVVEMWLKDYTEVPVYEDRPMTIPGAFDETGAPVMMVDAMGMPVTEQVQTGTKPKYPGFIRCIHFANGGKVVLDDVPNPSINPNMPEEMAQNTYLWDKYPYNKGNSYEDENNFWGYSIIEQIETLVLEINKKVSQIAAYIDKTVRPPLIMPLNAGIRKGDISNLPGQVWWPNNHMVAQFIRYLEVPSLPHDFYKYIELLLKLVDIITGIHDVTEGRKPKGVSAASAIMALQEKAETIFRDKIRNLDMLIEERGRMWVSLAQNWYTEPRKLQLSGKYVQTIGEFTEFQGGQFTGEHSFKVVSGSTMPKSVFAQREHAIQLFQAGAIDQRAILEAFEWPFIEEVIQRMSLGPLGQLIERLQMAGMPEQTLQVIYQIGSMEENEFKATFGVQPMAAGGAQLPTAQAGKG